MSDYPTEDPNPRRSPLPESSAASETPSEKLRRKRKHHHGSSGADGSQSNNRHNHTGTDQHSDAGAALNVEDCDSPHYSSVAAGPGSARARANSQSTNANSNSNGHDATQGPTSGSNEENKETPHGGGGYPTEGSDVAMQDMRPEDRAATTGGAGRRNSPVPAGALPPLSATRSTGQTIPVPPAGPSPSASNPQTPYNARRASDMGAGSVAATTGSAVPSRVGEQDVSLTANTPRRLDVDDGHSDAFSPRSDGGQPMEDDGEVREEMVPGHSASPAQKETTNAGCVRPRPSATHANASESRSTTSGTNDGKHYPTAPGTVAGHADRDLAGNVMEGANNHGEDHDYQGNPGTEHYEDLDQNPMSDVESDDESFQAAKPACASCCVDRSDPDSWRYQKPRKSGIERPFHANQIAAFIVFVVGNVFYYTGTIPAYVMPYQDGADNFPEMICAIVICTPFMLLFASVWIALTFIEAGDFENEGEMCTYCARRTSKGSKHCKACNKCVSKFDHHCKWLNVCVGGKNYKLFMTYVTSGMIMILSAFSMSIAVVAKWWHTLENYNAYFRVAPILCAALMLVSSFPIGHLLFFHIMLIMRGMTTYQYILWKREKKLNRNAGNPQDPKRKERRLFSLSKKSKKEKASAAAPAAATGAGAPAAGAGNVDPQVQLQQELAKAAAAMRGD